MYELITISYTPINFIVSNEKNNFNGDTSNLISFTQFINKKSLNVNFEQLIGLILTANQISSPKNIKITRNNGDIIDIINIESLTRINYNYNYKCQLGILNVKFESIDFIKGVSLMCLLFGVNPSNLINEAFYNNESIIFEFNRYIGKILLTNNLLIDNMRHSLPILYFKNAIQNQYETTIKILKECFNSGEYSTILLPSIMYITSTDKNYNNIIATASATTNFSFLPNKYHNLNNNQTIPTIYYILSVCTGNKYRGQGITKSLLIALINELIIEGARTFLLEVDPRNINAYKLYNKLGFIKIDDTFDNIHYDLLSLKIEI